MINIYMTRLPNGMTCEAAGEASLGLKNGDYAIIKRDYSLEYVQIMRELKSDAPAEETNLLAPVQRIATVIDRATATENEAHAKSAYRTACQMVEKMQLPMKLLNASYSFDRKLVTIQFTADGIKFILFPQTLCHGNNIHSTVFFLLEIKKYTIDLAVCRQVKNIAPVELFDRKVDTCSGFTEHRAQDGFFHLDSMRPRPVGQSACRTRLFIRSPETFLSGILIVPQISHGPPRL